MAICFYQVSGPRPHSGEGAHQKMKPALAEARRLAKAQGHAFVYKRCTGNPKAHLPKGWARGSLREVG